VARTRDAGESFLKYIVSLRRHQFISAMRLSTLTLLLLLLAACGDPVAPPAPTPAPVATIPTDRQVIGDPAIDDIRAEAGRIDDQFEAGMLQQKNVPYTCGDIRGVVELYTEKGTTVLTRSKYSDGDTRTVIDNSYFKDGALIFHYAETNTWEFDGTMRTLSNNSEVPGVRNTTAEYRYYVADGTVFRFLKRKYDHFTYALDNPNPDTLSLQEMTPGKGLPFRYGLASQALETGAVSCDFFE